MSDQRIFDKLDDIGKVVTRLETHMETLIGNGQPGKIALIEEKLDSHEALINRGKGVKWIIALLAGSGAIGALVQAKQTIQAFLK